jgi:hypothetical protein
MLGDNEAITRLSQMRDDDILRYIFRSLLVKCH